MSASPGQGQFQGHPPPGQGHEVFNDNDVVITGMSGLFPKCHNVSEFGERLMAKENMIECDRCRWNYNHPEVSRYTGRVPDLEKFDAQFFMVHYRLSNSMDCMTKKLMENAYQAIYDSGTNPGELSGKKLGVFVGIGATETEKLFSYINVGLGIVGTNRAMMSNRISYILNAKGPSVTIEGHESGSMLALTKAYEAIKHGECDTALVGGSSVHLHPQNFIHYGRLMEINNDGNMKCYANNADGQSQSEAIIVIFLQKYKNAKRVYGKLCHSKCAFIPCGEDPVGQVYGFYRPVDLATRFLSDFYREAKLAPELVDYIDGNGSGIGKADKAELEAFDKIFCRNRKNKLYVGSVMSNIGTTEAPNGLVALTKVCIGFQRGRIPASINCEKPRDDVAAIQEGRLRIATDGLPVRNTYAAINNMSLSGINTHALLQGHYKPKDLSRYKSPIPYLVTISSRQESGVRYVLDELKDHPVDPEEIALIHSIHKTKISKQMSKGYTVLDTNEANETVSLGEGVRTFDEGQRPLWFVYSGMGSQWAGMGLHLMKIPIFADAINKCHKILAPKGVDLLHIVTTQEKNIFDNIMHSFVGIAAIQIGLTDILNAIGIVPDNIIGHSVGELGCAYADGSLTAEEMILSAYSRGLVSLQTPFIKGSMAAVGLGFKQIVKLLPPEIEVACHNGPESSTISGPADIMTSFVAELTSKGVFAKEVPCSNIAYHSRYIKEAGPSLLKYLNEVIKTPKLRTKKWLSTSVPEERWKEPIAKYSSAEYHTNNLLSSVLFEETSRFVPTNALLVEVAPHGLLQAILKRSLPKSCVNVALTRRGHEDNAVMLLNAIGKIFMMGFDPDLSALYPKVEFPVSTSTRNISHLVQWVHSEKWNLPLYDKPNRKHATAAEFSVSYHDDDSQYLRGHIVDGEIIYPAGAILTSVWDTLAMYRDVPRKQLSVQFRDVTFRVHALLKSDEPLRLNIDLQKGSGWFEVTIDGRVLLANGYIDTECVELPNVQMSQDDTKICADDVYRALYEKNYEYKDEFRSILSVNKSLTRAEVTWTGNWVTLLDSFFQINLLRTDEPTALHVHNVQRITIDAKRHKEYVNKKVLDAIVAEDGGITACAGVAMETITFVKRPLHRRQILDLKTLKFVPYFQKDLADISKTLNVFLQIVSENLDTSVISLLEISEKKADSMTAAAGDSWNDLPDQKIALRTINRTDILNPKYKTDVPNVVLMNNILMDNKTVDDLHNALPQNMLMVILEETSRTSTSYRVISSAITPRGRLVLAKWRPTASGKVTAVNVTSQKDLLLLYSMRQKMQANDRLVVLTTFPVFNGLKDLIKKYRKDPPRNNIILAVVDDNTFKNVQGKQMPDFDLAFNTLHKGTWGSELYLPYEETKKEVKDNVILRSPCNGGIDSVEWVEAPQVQQQKGIMVKVHYAGLNYLDAKRATGEAWTAPTIRENTYGMDYSGVTKSGERVMGVVRCGAAASQVIAEPSLLWPVPAHWSMEDAATVPLAYAQAFYLLTIQCKMVTGMRILVHGASGGLGQAIINIALSQQCTIFATVSDVKKKRFLKKLFPEIPEENICNSRDPSFEETVLSLTRGAGCDLVISCVKGNLINSSLACIGDLGLMLDTHMVHAANACPIGMYCLTRSRSFVRTDFASILDESDQESMRKIQYMLAEGVQRGYVRPLTRVTYEWREAARALRLLAASRHRGRVLLALAGPAPRLVPRMSCSPTGTTLIVSADNDSMATVQLAELLVKRGARHVTIWHRSGHVLGAGHVQLKLRAWAKTGVNVKILIEKLTQTDQIASLIEDMTKTGPVEGIYVVATKPNDDTEPDLISFVSALDAVSRKTCPKLKQFAVLTTPGSLDAAEEICCRRSLLGLPAIVVKMASLIKFNETCDENNKITWNIAIEAFERAMCGTNSIALASAKPTPSTTILEEVSQIPGVCLQGIVNEHVSMQDIGMDVEGFKMLAEVLQTKFKVMVDQQDVPHLTISNLKTIQDKLNVGKDEVVTGLKTFISHIEEDELLANTKLIPMTTLGDNAAKRPDELCDSSNYVVLIPGLEGSHAKFLSLAARLKVPAVVFQPDLDSPELSIVELAEHMTKLMLKSVKLENKFYLLGYSSGALVTMEMARMLEEKGYEGTVYCVDAEPGTFPKQMESWLETSKGEEHLHNLIMEHFYNLFTGDSPREFGEGLKNFHNWNDKVDFYLKSLQGRTVMTKQYCRCLIENAYGRIQQVLKYKPDNLKKSPLKSQIVLLRSRCKFANGDDIQKYTQKKVISYDLESDHARALEDLRCTSAVNRHLAKEIIEEYERKNLCNTYLLNASDFFDYTEDVSD